MIAPSARYFCPQCAETPAIGRKDAALPWTFWCSVHGVRLMGAGSRPMESVLPGSVLERLDPPARRGAARLAAWAQGRDPAGETGAPTVPDLLHFLSAPYRRSSPPSLAEQPRLSLEARRGQPPLSDPADHPSGAARRRARIQPLRARARQAGSSRPGRPRSRLAVAELRLGRRGRAADRTPGRARRGDAGGGRRRGGSQPAPDAPPVAAGDAQAHRRPRAAPAGGRDRCESRLGARERGRMATQSHKLCSSPANSGAIRPMNCESKSRNYARSGRAAG